MGRAAEVFAQQEVTRRRPAREDFGVNQPFSIPAGKVGDPVAVALTNIRMGHIAFIDKKIVIRV